MLQLCSASDHASAAKKSSCHKNSQSYVHSLDHDAVRMQAAHAAGVAEGKAAAAVQIKRCAAL